MAQADNTETLYVEVPPSLKYLVDEDDRTNKELVISALETELGVSSQDSVAVLDRQIKRLEDRFEAEKSDLEAKQDRLNNIRSKLDRARGIRREKVQVEGSYEDRLDSVLDDLADPEDTLTSIFPNHGCIDDIREEFDRSNDEIHLDLQRRAAMQNRELSVAAFKDQQLASEADKRTPISDVWGGGGDAE